MQPAFGLVEPHEVHSGTFLNPVQIHLNGIPFFCCISCTALLGVVSKLAEGALNSLCRLLIKTVHFLMKPLNAVCGYYTAALNTRWYKASFVCCSEII